MFTAHSPALLAQFHRLVLVYCIGGFFLFPQIPSQVQTWFSSYVGHYKTERQRLKFRDFFYFFFWLMIRLEY